MTAKKFSLLRVSKTAFSLVELSIVLVILGLLVGGVLTGRSLIQSAQAKAQIAQIDAFRAATLTFRDKYFYLPGDIPDTIAGRLNFTQGGSVYGGVSGDGNGIFDQGGNWQMMGEPGNFWVHLGQSGLINGSYTLANRNSQDPNVTAYVPAAKLGDSLYIQAFPVTTVQIVPKVTIAALRGMVNIISVSLVSI